jgi:putative ABC transport system substrate-binding protein
MGRFALIARLLLSLLFVFAPTTVSRAATKMLRIGVLCAPSCTAGDIGAFWEELRRLGWVEGATIVIDRKEPLLPDQLPALAAELVRSKPDLIVATSPQSARAAKDATSEIAIAFFWVADPVGIGLASSLAHPGGNVTGAATLVPGDFNGKVFGILRELLPHAKRLAALINLSNEVNRLLFTREAPPAAAKLGLELDVFDLRSPEELPGAVTAAKASGADVLYVIPDVVLSIVRTADLAAKAGLPSMSITHLFARSGGMISYGPDFSDVARLGARYVDRILKGARPAELPIEQPSKYQLVINLKTARSLGVEIPASLLARADEVIE